MVELQSLEDAPQWGRAWQAHARLALALAVILTAALPGYYNRRDIGAVPLASLTTARIDAL